MSNISKRRREGSRAKIKSMGDHKEFLKRITKTLYYGQLPSLPCLSLPVTEISCGVWSAVQRGRSVRRLHLDAAAGIARAACVSPAALVLALLYLERLRAHNPDYLAHTAPQDLFLVTLMVGNKFLQDDGEDEEVICSEWAASGGLELGQLKRLELDFLGAIDWNVYVNEKSFERGLSWLERRVALRQAAARGFFTYSDLLAAAPPPPPLAALAAGGAVAALAYLASLLALLSGALAAPAIVHHLAGAASPASPAPPHTTLPASLVTPHGFLPPLTLTRYVPNSTVAGVRAPCCARWRHRHLRALDATLSQHQHTARPEPSWEEWWARQSVLQWMRPTALLDPLRRWLDRIDQYADLTLRQLGKLSSKHARDPRCSHNWFNLGAVVTSVSDR